MLWSERSIGVLRMPEDVRASEETRLTEMREVYNSVLAPVVEEFYATIRANDAVGPFCGEGLVGLLTFPNSGTSWFLRLTARASGICNHTAYEKESVKTKGAPSRGAYSIHLPGARSPEPGEPSFIKSHVHYYGRQSVLVEGAGSLRRFAATWRGALPPGCDRHVRLVRNPLDNLRARYHLHLKDMARADIEADATDMEAFRAYFRTDLRRYLQWHAYCDELAATTPVLPVRYERFLDPKTAVEEIGRAMRFAGYTIGDDAIATALAKVPPKYVADPGMPIHLGRFAEADIRWVADAIREWLEVYADAREGRPRFAARLHRLILGTDA